MLNIITIINSNNNFISVYNFIKVVRILKLNYIKLRLSILLNRLMDLMILKFNPYMCSLILICRK